jgi:hypothetical protein
MAGKKAPGMLGALDRNEAICLANKLTSGAGHLAPNAMCGDRGAHWDTAMELCDLADEADDDTRGQGRR